MTPLAERYRALRVRPAAAHAVGTSRSRRAVPRRLGAWLDAKEARWLVDHSDGELPVSGPGALRELPAVADQPERIRVGEEHVVVFRAMRPCWSLGAGGRVRRVRPRDYAALLIFVRAMDSVA